MVLHCPEHIPHDSEDLNNTHREQPNDKVVWVERDPPKACPVLSSAGGFHHAVLVAENPGTFVYVPILSAPKENWSDFSLLSNRSILNLFYNLISFLHFL